MLPKGVCAACLAVVCGVLSTLFNSIQPQPYMVSQTILLVLTYMLSVLQDEEFHIPQAQRFCSHNFSYWDPMITTLPGL